MKKYLMTALTIALAAGTAFAQDQGGNVRQAPPGMPGNCERGGPPMQGRQAMRGHQMMDPEAMAQMHADQKAIMELGAAARAETNDTLKAEIVAKIRAKFGELADRRAANHQKRIAQAEKALADLKTKFEEDTANRDALIEKQIERVLAGERPMMPQRDRQVPQAKGGMPEGPEGGIPPPPSGDDMRGNMPQPPPMDQDMPQGEMPPPSGAGEDMRGHMPPPPMGDDMYQGEMQPPAGEDMPAGDTLPPPGE